MRIFNNKWLKSPKTISLLWLLLGTLPLFFCNADYIVPIAPWIAYVFLMRFVRTQKPLTGLLVSMLACMVVSIVINRNAFPLPGMAYYAAAGFFGFVFWVPFIADRLIAYRLKGILSTFVFPLAYVTWEYIYASFSPYLSFGSLAYTQYGILPTMQLSALIGIWGILFIITWFASIINWLWERNFDFKGIRLQAGVITGFYILTFLLGGLSTAVFSPKSTTVRISSVVATPKIETLLEGTNWDDFWGGQDVVYEKTEKDTTELIFKQVLDEYLAISSQQAQTGSKIILWQEGAAFCLKEDEDKYIDTAQKLAQKENIYLFMSMLVMPDSFPEVFAENKVICIDPKGDGLFEYLKSFPVPGEPSKQGQGKIPVIETPYGRVALAICFDYNNPMYIRQAGIAGSDIMLNPAYDWKGITPYHAYPSAYRAVENGASLVRCTGHGISIAYDYQGRVLSAQNYFNDSQGVMVSDVPIKGMTTLYPLIGDLFAWASISMFLVLCVFSFVFNKRNACELNQKQNEELNVN